MTILSFVRQLVRYVCTGTQASNGTPHSVDASNFAMEGPMVALLMPFKPDSLNIDDASFIKYLQVLWSVHGMSCTALDSVTTRGARHTMQYEAWCVNT